MYVVITARYKGDELQLMMRVTFYRDEAELLNISLEEIENDETSTVYKKNNIDHLFINNFDRLQAVWKGKNCLYNISGDISIEDMERMVNSSYGG